MFEKFINEMVLEEKEKYWKGVKLKKYIKDTIKMGYIDCDKGDYELTYILENLQKINDAINYIYDHYDLATEDNAEFCILRDRVLGILKGDE